MNIVTINRISKAMMMKEALASCQMEGIGLDLTLEDLYLAELGYYKNDKSKEVIKRNLCVNDMTGEQK